MNPFTENTGKTLMWLGIGLFIVGLLLFLWNSFLFDTSLPIDATKFGQFGDFIGGLVGSIWAFAGVILFYVALSEQRTDIQTNREVLKTQVEALEKQIDEFELQREELELTRNVFIEQSKTLRKQQFESTFFNSMNMLNNIIDSITYVLPPPERMPVFRRDQPVIVQSDQTKVFHGRDSFEYFYADLKKEYQLLYSDYVIKNLRETYSEEARFNVPVEVQQDFAEKAYENFFAKEHSDLGHYFRTIYNIVKFVNENAPETPKYYTSLLRAQLSTYEHLLLFYNGQSQFGVDKFKPLIIQYSLLDNMSTSELLDDKHTSIYPDKAYE